MAAPDAAEISHKSLVQQTRNPFNRPPAASIFYRGINSNCPATPNIEHTRGTRRASERTEREPRSGARAAYVDQRRRPARTRHGGGGGKLPLGGELTN